MRLVLGSQSPARLNVLRSAGIDPVVRVSGVDEDAVAAALTDPRPDELVTALAEAKAHAVVAALAVDALAGESLAGESLAGESLAGESLAGQSLAGQSPAGQSPAGQSPAGQSLAEELAGQSPAGELATELLKEAVVIGCDSMLSINGAMVGKPGTPEVARARWREMAGKTGELLTGHVVLRLADGVVDRVAKGAESTTVRFGTPSDAELEAYIATGEPLAVAGGFTLDGMGGWFVDGIDGDHSSVIGISLPLTRRLLAEVGVSVVDLWTAS